MDIQCPVMQGLMDKAYENWQKHDDWGYEEFIATLDAKPKFVVLLGNLNYQVENGGFSQWYDNRFSVYGRELLTHLKMYKDRDPVIQQVIDLVERAMTEIEKFKNTKSQHRFYNVDYEDDSESYEELSSDLHSLDSEYYKINKKFMEAMEKIISEL